MTLSLTSITRKVLIAGAVAMSFGVAMPTQAADNVQFGFSFGNGNSGFGFSLGNGGYNGRHFNPPPVQRVCMSIDQVSGQLRAQGYRRISFEGEHRGWVHASAKKNGWFYEFDVNRCTGAIANLVATGGGGGFPQGGFPQGGFGGFGSGFGGGPGFHR